MIQKIFNKIFDLSIKNKFSPCREVDEAIKKLSSLIEIDVVIDIGAGFGTKEIYDHFIKKKFFLIEANKDFEKQLIENSKNLNKEIFFEALGQDNNLYQFNIYADKTKSSFFKHSLKKGNSIQKMIRTIRLDDLLYKKLNNQKCFIKIDVEGSELNVLKGGKKILENNCIGLITELNILPKFGENNQHFFSIYEYLNKLNFVLYDICSPRDYKNIALQQCDGIFLKKEIVKKITN